MQLLKDKNSHYGATYITLSCGTQCIIITFAFFLFFKENKINSYLYKKALGNTRETNQSGCETSGVGMGNGWMADMWGKLQLKT